MTDNTWKKMSPSPEKFLKAENYIAKAYTGILEAIYPSETKGTPGVPYIKLDFEGGSSLSIFGLDKQNDDGTYPFALATFLKSAESLGLEVQEARVDGIIQGIQITKDGVPLEKPTISIRGIKDEVIGDESQTKTYFKWGILEKIEIKEAPKQPIRKGGYSKSKTAEEKPALSSVKDSVELDKAITMLIMDENGKSTPKSMMEIFEALGGPGKVKMATVRPRVEALAELIDGKYQIS